MEKATPRQMFKQIGFASITWGEAPSPGVPATDTVIGGNWEVLTDPTGTFHHIVNRSYIDLSGYTLDDLTVFTQGVDIQKEFTPNTLVPTAVPKIMEIDYLTTRRISDGELTQIGTNGSIPGFTGTAFDLMEVVYGERMEYSENTQVPLTYIQTSGDTFGSGNPSTADKLHWTRHYIVPNAAAGTITQIYPTNLVVQAITGEEKELVYIERLRRSYTQQRQDS
jgi:hypothetical protein